MSKVISVKLLFLTCKPRKVHPTKNAAVLLTFLKRYPDSLCNKVVQHKICESRDRIAQKQRFGRAEKHVKVQFGILISGCILKVH